MTDPDRELAEYSERWRAAEPPLPEHLLRMGEFTASRERDGSRRSRARATRRRRRARQRRTITVVAFALVVVSVPVWLAVTRGSSNGVDRTITKNDALDDVRAAIGKTVAAGSYEDDIETHSTQPGSNASCPPQVTCANSSSFDATGHMIVNFEPAYILRSDSENNYGNTTLYVTPTNIWLTTGAGAAPPPGSGTPLSMFAKSMVGALGPSQGGLAAIALATPGGHLNLQEQAVSTATPAGTGDVRGIPVTYYDVTIDMRKLADTPDLSDVQRDTVNYVLPLLAQGGYSGTTERIGISDDGYIREITLTNHFTDGSTGTQRHVLSNIGCAPKLYPPNEPAPPAEPPPACEPATSRATTAPATTETTTPTSTAPTGSPLSSGLQRPTGVAVGRNGEVYVADAARHEVLRRGSDGRVTVFAGTGSAGFSGDGGPAVDAMLNGPGALAVASDGALYIADTANNRIRKVDRGGGISTVATAPGVRSLAFGRDGKLLVADSAGVERAESDGSLTTVLEGGPGKVVIDGAPNFFEPTAVAVDGDGNLVVANSSPKWVARFTPTGEVLGSWTDYVTPGGIATGPDGVAYLASHGFFAIERLAPGGPEAVVKFDRDAVPGIDGTFRPSGVAVGPDGTIYAITNGGGTTNDRALVAISRDGTVTPLIVN